jgi:glycosyltransferase involved in cell wall biosynthesis
MLDSFEVFARCQIPEKAHYRALDGRIPMPKPSADGVASGYRLLLVSSDNFPVTRVDVAVLFGVVIAGRGHTVDLIVQSEAACAIPYLAQWEAGRVWVAATDLGTSLLHRIRKHLRSMAADLKLFGWMRSGHYDLVIIKDKFLSGILGLLAARLYRLPFVYWLSYPFAEAYIERARDRTARYPWLYLIRGHVFGVLLYRVLLPYADHVFVQSAQMRRDVTAQGIQSIKISAVPMGVLPAMFPVQGVPLVRRVLPIDAPCILYLGTLGRSRHLDFLLRVLKRVRVSVPAALLYFVGRGDEPSDVEFLASEARRLGLRNAVLMTGQLPRAEAFAFVAEADVCVSPIYPSPVLIAGSPTKLIEYMAMGKAVVANDHPDQRLLIEESGAGYCVAYEEKAFEDAILRLLTDPGGARRMGERGRSYVLAHRSYEVIGRDVEAELIRIIEQGRNRAPH